MIINWQKSVEFCAVYSTEKNMLVYIEKTEHSELV